MILFTGKNNLNTFKLQYIHWKIPHIVLKHTTRFWEITFKLHLLQHGTDFSFIVSYLHTVNQFYFNKINFQNSSFHVCIKEPSPTHDNCSCFMYPYTNTELVFTVLNLIPFFFFTLFIYFIEGTKSL